MESTIKQLSASDLATTREYAAFYKARGFQPLPSRMDSKRPMIRFADLWDTKADENLFERFETTNLQLMTGRHFRLLVIDLDGQDARDRWSTMGRTPTTWTTHSGGGGWHLWFRLPANYPIELPKAFLWQSDERRDAIKHNMANPDDKIEVPHAAIERLCDKSLVMAPPSIHPTTGERYRFESPRTSPKRLPMPADCPDWILRLKPLEAPRPELVMHSGEIRVPIVVTTSNQHFDRDDVINAIRDKGEVARQWGLRIAGKPTEKGWQPCHAVGRKDRTPSAALHLASGIYVDQGSGIRMSFLDLGVAMGVYGDWQDALHDLGSKYAHRN